MVHLNIAIRTQFTRRNEILMLNLKYLRRQYKIKCKQTKMKSKFRSGRQLQIDCAGVIQSKYDGEDFELSPWNLTDIDLTEQAGKNEIKNQSQKIDAFLLRLRKEHRDHPKKYQTVYQTPLVTPKKDHPLNYDEFVKDRKNDKSKEAYPKISKTIYHPNKKQERQSSLIRPKLPLTPTNLHNKILQPFQTIGLSASKTVKKHSRKEKIIKRSNSTLYPEYMGLSQQRKARNGRGRSLQPLYQVYLYYCRDASQEPKRSHEDALRTMLL